MRFVIYGAGAIGGTAAVRLVQAGQDVAVIARGEHGAAIAERGLRLRSPDDDVTVPLPVAADPAGIDWRADDVVLLSIKSQDTVPALRALAAAAPPSVSVVCAQNGVQNERMALRRFAHVYGMVVMCPAAHLQPGEVMVNCAPVSAILDLGRYPHGTDETAEAIAAGFAGSAILSTTRPDIMRWKYRKLLLNLGNAIQALCADDPGGADLGRRARKEAHAVYAAAGIDPVSADEDVARRQHHLDTRPIDGRHYAGWSTWQSLERVRAGTVAAGSVEVDYLNGEIVLLGRLHGVPTPVNEALQRLVTDLARRRGEPGSLTAADIESAIGSRPNLRDPGR